ncbi:TetR/AcrR family transcriptional regulator [Domibacillus sp. PGB-M46]|uniref:TetR/AcrR family transcriptional regulator n=1 Tax=Domibacillus sp. PGB-M46 TaxID=2910255 RepID=UPI001F560FC6|nr:TetR/AcrR family transcriptional regulator [Domibacillus sp. PGB-M46]MCI2252817.1 TetR/AcrR family transcriptional regulator [Domibacillus sp. PGB-M46]
MTEKEQRIIEESLKLFAQKGFAATSIQEIATACDISKGAFYLHFKSKEALLLAVLHYYFDLLSAKIKTIESENLSPREKFVKQIECQMREIQQHKEFLIMQARENAIPFNDDIEAFIFKMRTETHQLYRNRLIGMYGREIEPYFWDLSAALQGIQHAFLHMTLVDGIELDVHSFAEFLLDSADDLQAGLKRRAKPPVIDSQIMENLFKHHLNDDLFVLWLSDLKQENWSDDILVSLDVIEQELQSSSPRPAVLRGMLANLTEEPSLHEFMQAVKNYYKLG